MLFFAVYIGLIFSLQKCEAQFTSIGKVIGGFKIFYEKIEACPVKDVENMVNATGIRLIRINKQLIGLKGKIIVNYDMPQDTRARINIKGLKNGKWSEKYLEIKPTKVCEFVKTDKYFYPRMTAMSTLPPACPIKKGEYSLQVGMKKESNFMPLIPHGCWQLMVTLDNQGKDIGCFSFFIKVTDHAGSPQPRCTG